MQGGGALVDGNGKDSSCNNPTRAPSRTPPMKLLKPLLLSAVLATGFLAVLVLLLGGTASYSLRRLTVPDVLESAQPARAPPCAQQQQQLGLEQWTRPPPESAWHNMSDEELLWAASWEPRVRRCPYRRVPKVAFMFLTRGPLPLAPLWERFFNGNSSRELYSVYVHSTPGYRPAFPPTSVFYRRQVPSKMRWWRMNSCSSLRWNLSLAITRQGKAHLEQHR